MSSVMLDESRWFALRQLCLSSVLLGFVRPHNDGTRACIPASDMEIRVW
jgi:hypothetical protein